MPRQLNRKRKTFSCIGVLEGMGSRTQCVVMGTHEVVEGEPRRVIRLNIAQEPTHMLDGLYTVRFGEELAQVERRGGLWLFIMIWT